VKIKPFLSVGIVLVILLAGIFSGCSPKLNGNMPQFVIGDKWVLKWYSGAGDYTVTSEVSGEDMINGKNCWVMETTFDPVYQGVLTGVTNKYDKVNLDLLSSDYHSNDGKSTSITYQVSGDSYYPLSVGKKALDIEDQTISTTTTGTATVTQTENVTVTTSTVVEKIEKVTVTAGTFTCFKVLKYDDSGKLTSISWRTDKTKLFQVKMTDMNENNTIYELISYSVH
jgi:hypothetical protein